MIKTFIKKWSFVFALLFVLGTLGGEEKVYASEYEIVNVPQKRVENIINEEIFFVADGKVIDALKGHMSLDENAALFCTADTPDNVASLMTLSSNDYEVVPYSYTKYVRTTNIFGDIVMFATINVSGEVYIYSDGKVHLFSMRTKATAHQSGWNVSIKTRDLCNTDGSISIGYSYVYYTKQDVEHEFVCKVFILKDDKKPSVTIGQAY